MERYKFLKQGVFESLQKFEKKLNQMVQSGWKVVSMTNEHGVIVVLLEQGR